MTEEKQQPTEQELKALAFDLMVQRDYIIAQLQQVLAQLQQMQQKGGKDGA